MSFLTGDNETWQLVDMESFEEVLTFQTFLDMDVKDEGKAVSAQVEEGSFASYNKTDSPLDAKVTLGLQGDDGELQSAIETLSDLRASTKLIGIVTPMMVCLDMTLEAFDYQLKRENGRGVLFVSLHLVEVRQVAAEYTDVKLAPQQKRGQVQTKEQQQPAEKKQSMLYMATKG
jgi:hypothetical protein